jgi:outer membrane protein OmpA-like peptidoglycan-associated protein
LLTLAPPAPAQNLQGGTPRVTLDASTGTLTLSFALSAARLSSGDDRLTLTPVLESGGAVATFPPVVVEGRRARVSRERKERSDLLAPDAAATYLPVGMPHYHEVTLVVPDAAAWGGATARLSLRALNERCDCEIEIATRETASLDVPLSIVNVPAPVVPPVTPTFVPVARQQAILDSIAAPYPFVGPVTPQARELLSGEVTPSDVERYVDEHRVTSLTVYFAVGKSAIDLSTGDNARSLNTLLEAIRSLESAPGHPRVRVLVGGFASPEGSTQLNEWLARERALALRDYLVARSRLTLDDVLVHGAGADWQGLRSLVAASRMLWRADVLRIIDTYPVWNPRARVGRLTTLVNLDGGRPYRYLLERFFPRLRAAAVIKVFYETGD